jgi:hypothetical protein
MQLYINKKHYWRENWEEEESICSVCTHCMYLYSSEGLVPCSYKAIQMVFMTAVVVDMHVYMQCVQTEHMLMTAYARSFCISFPLPLTYVYI